MRTSAAFERLLAAGRRLMALIERSLQQAQALLGGMPGLVLHGGGAPSLRERLPAHAWRPDAVLRGLARWHALRIA